MIAELRSFKEDLIPRGSSEVTDVTYDIWTLRVTVEIEGHDGVVYFSFDSPIGFRVLDEGDLSDFWANSDKAPLQCVSEVLSGGWLDLESSRDDFLTDSSDCREYMIGGVNSCVSVISHDPPDIQVVE